MNTPNLSATPLTSPSSLHPNFQYPPFPRMTSTLSHLLASSLACFPWTLHTNADNSSVLLMLCTLVVVMEQGREIAVMVHRGPSFDLSWAALEVTWNGGSGLRWKVRPYIEVNIYALIFTSRRSSAYNDIVVLPITENMNDGKSHAYFTWAASNAWVPPLYLDPTPLKAVPTLSYADQSNPAPILAPHDPLHAHLDQQSGVSKPWVRPDYVVKADDDGFIMLAELEARLRVELYIRTGNSSNPSSSSTTSVLGTSDEAPNSSLSPRAPSPDDDPLIYWGYLVKHRFMGGEMYALSHRLVNFVATDPQVKTMTKGAEDKATASWMKVYPRPKDIRWARERCWVYDHPRGGTVYSHGFLFPSEVKRVQQGVLEDLQRRFVISPYATGNRSDLWPSPFGPNGIHPEAWVQSSVTAWHVRYAAPISNLTTSQSIEALVEGSAMSRLHENDHASVESAYRHREGRNARYEGKRLGGTIMVHFIKKHMWFLEAALALLEGEDMTELEREGHR